MLREPETGTADMRRDEGGCRVVIATSDRVDDEAVLGVRRPVPLLSGCLGEHPTVMLSRVPEPFDHLVQEREVRPGVAEQVELAVDAQERLRVDRLRDLP